MMKKQSFEQSVTRLAEIVRKLEGGDLALEESLNLFEEGIKLFGLCQSELKAAEGKIEKLVKTLDGEYRTEPFEV